MTKIKLTPYLLSVLTITLGIGYKNVNLGLLGAYIFIVVQAIEFYEIIKMSLEYKNGTFKKLEKSSIEKLAYFAYSTLTLFSLVGVIISDVEEACKPAGIMLIGVFFIYIIGPLASSWITNIPMKHDYGGWKAYRPRRRKQ